MFNRRICTLIDICLKENGYISLESLSERVGKSVATIRVDIQKMQQVLAEYDVTLIKRRGVGVKIDGSKAAIEALRVSIREHENSTRNNLDVVDYQIVTFLLQNINKSVRMIDIAHSLHMSESAIQKKLIALKPVLAGFRVTVEAIQGKGIFISGSEEHIRKLYAKLLFKNHQTQVPVLSETVQLKDKIFSLLKVNPEPIFLAIRSCEEELGYSFTDESFQSLAIHIAVALKRIYQGKGVDETLYEPVDESKAEYKAALNLALQIEQGYDVQFGEGEIYYLFLHILSTKISKSEHVELNLDRIENRILHIAREIVKQVEGIKKISVSKKYLDNLILHLRPTVNRLEYDVILENPLLENIKFEYPEAYGIAWMCNSIFAKYLNKSLSDDEAAYIALHIQAMIESARIALKAIIVCSSGIGISQLLSTQIEQQFNRIDVIAVESIKDYMKNPRIDEADVIISTFSFKSELPLLIVSPILSSADIQRINDFIITEKSNVNTAEVIRHVFVKPKWQTQQEVLQRVSDFLLEKKEVGRNFYESLLHREKKHSTEIGNLIAIPHGESKYVFHSQVVIVTLAKPIIWGEESVDLILFVLVNENDKAEFTEKLKGIYRKLYSEEFHQLCIAAKDETEIIRLFCEV